MKIEKIQPISHNQAYEARTWLGGCCTGVRRGLMRGAASDAAARASVRHLSFFFFFFFFYGFAPTRLDSCWLSLIRAEPGILGLDSCQFAPNWADSTKIEPNQPNQVVSASNRNKSALNHAGITKIGFEWGPNILNLSFLNFIMNIRCFFCVFFFVLCFVFLAFFFLCFVNQGIVMYFLRIF